jgi:CRISPR-associated protein Csx10
MTVITYRVTLLEPTLVTALAGDPNSAVAFDYLPGSVLRGAVIGKYLRGKIVDPDKFSADTDARGLFFNGATRYLNGYLLENDERTLPTPQSWQREKGEETPLYDFAIEPPDDGEKQWQGVGMPVCLLTDDSVCLVQPDRLVTVHTARTRRFGRAMPERKIRDDEIPGAVYRYDALAAGQTFEAAIVCDNDAAAAKLLPLLTGEATLGGSRSAGYGRVALHNAKRDAATWREAGGTLTPDVDGKLIVTLLSDALLREANGQFVVDPDVVTAALEVSMKVPEGTLGQPEAFLHGKTIGGFNRKWGLPLPQVLAVGMGSVFVYGKRNCNVDKLSELEARGIGERRAEGFGRVAVNWHTRGKLKVDTSKPSAPPDKTLEPATDGGKVAQRMVERLVRQQLDERVSARANLTSISNPPHNAQLSRLRNIIHDELRKDTPNSQRVGDFVIDVKARSMARKQFERAHVGHTPLLKWLDDQSRIADWQTLLGFQAKDARTVGGVQPNLADKLRDEYMLRLIDAVLARAAKAGRGDD